MKTLVKTLFASIFAVIILSCSAFTTAAVYKPISPNETIIPMDFNKIVVRGNVRVELVQSTRQSVAIYNEIGNRNTTIMQKGDKLLITSSEDEPANIIVYVKNLQRIDAANTAVVTTRGKFSTYALQVFLKDSARAYVNAETSSLYTVIKDRADLKLKGSSDDHTLAKSKAAKLNVDHFAALKFTTAPLDGQIVAINY